MTIDYAKVKRGSVLAIAFLALALTCLAEPAEKGDNKEVLEDLLRKVESSSVGQSVEELKLRLAEEIESFTGADAEIDFIRGFKEFLFNEDWMDEAKWRAYLRDYPKLLSEALIRYSTKNLDTTEGTSFGTNKTNLSAVHQEMMICLKELKKKIVANEGVQGDYKVERMSRRITIVAGHARLYIADQLASDVHNMCALEGRRAAIEDIKAIGLPDELLDDVADRLWRE